MGVGMAVAIKKTGTDSDEEAQGAPNGRPGGCGVSARRPGAFQVSGMGGGIEGDRGWWGGHGGGGGLRMGPMAYRVFWRISSASRLHVLPSQPVPVLVNPLLRPGTGETKTLISYLP